MDITERALNNEYIETNSSEFPEIKRIVEKNAELLTKFNYTYQTKKQRQDLFSQITQQSVSSTNEINAPFHTDFGPHIFLGENDFINIDCTFVDLGGIYLGNNVLIGPRTTIISVNHAEEPEHRSDLRPKSVHIKDGAWLGAGVMVLPGVTIGENAIVGAGSIVTKDIPDNMIAVGNPARVIREVRD
ncbi:sugar O-acetyltransferase [Companilactobacillus ginsenosidimutans]|uniref:Acetyltransferase n=1 Tax=Companilactobacillus ginsenosidimutans TaxID=1007676 RepID=A0A0H4R1I1_9LACO|nr:sugar O-acetyltransferase [Companilactobacillus ginsenosidimutans]AKP67585.1 acetyltransferase [Companilactobacillus ginsenosidimutans]